MAVHKIGSEALSIDKIEMIISENHKLELSEEAIKRIVKCRAYLDKKIEGTNDAVYGINTGFGSLCNVSISAKDLKKLQENLVRSHACGMGEEIPKRITKLMLLFKAHALSYGNSGVAEQTVQRIIDFFNHDIVPVIYQQGSLGASGDLAPLAHMSLALIGEGEVYYQNKKSPASEVLKRLNLKPVQLQSKEGLALLNGTQFMSSHIADSVMRAQKLYKLADIAGATSLDAYNGRIDPFNENLHRVRPHKGQINTGKNISNILKGSQILTLHKNHVQDPYSFRCMPQVHGASKDTLDYVESVLITEINSVTDNPIVFPDEDLILSGGNFHGQSLALIADFLSIATAELGSISERRIYRLISGERDLPVFLVANPGLNSGFMIPQYTAASIVSQNKQLCTPSSVDSISSSNEQEDHVSMGANAATKLVKVIDNFEKILAIEFFTAFQALEFRRPLKSSETVEKMFKEFRKIIPFVQNDTIMYEHMNAGIKFLNDVKI